MVVRLIVRWAIAAAALVVAAWLIPGISVEGGNAWAAVAVMALVLGFVNAVIRPVLTLLSCGCITLTLGLFIFVINGFTLWLSSKVAQGLFSADFVVEGFWAALFGAIVVSIVSLLLSFLVPNEAD